MLPVDRLANWLKRPYRLAFFLVLPVAALIVALVWWLGASVGFPAWHASADDLNPALRGYHLRGRTLPLPNPGGAGAYAVQSFTYGDGGDHKGSSYRGADRFVTASVDGSKLDTQWAGLSGQLRSRYWGFDAAHLPIRGRVWMPQGAGPFPMVLIVHGNHSMEDASENGYAYLGEHLASQGFVAVSINENFLNGGGGEALADSAQPGSGQENAARAWLLLQHLKQWRTWMSDTGNPLVGKVDMDRIALIGHSRGGEAVSLANAFNNLGYFPDDATVEFDFHFHIRGIAALAPTEGQYRPRASDVAMRDQNFLVIQGSLDRDNRSFTGAPQYSRASFSGNTPAFKASVYIKDADHDQFNTLWGGNDHAGSGYQSLLAKRPMMRGEDQRRVAIVYLSAFLDMTLKGEYGYRPLFQDARNGAGWLPDVFIVNNYADSRMLWLANYEEDSDPATGSVPDVSILGKSLSVWREQDVHVKSGLLGTHAALLAWDDRVDGSGAPSYTLDFAKPLHAVAGMDLVFSVSQAAIDTLPKGLIVPGPRGNAGDVSLNWSVVVSDRAGQAARLELSSNQVLYPQITGDMDSGGQIQSLPWSEVVMRRYAFALKDFAASNPRLDLGQIKVIRFEFDRSPRGAIVLDDIALAPASQ